MKKRKFTKGEKTALIVLAIIMALVIGVGAYIIVNNVNNANKEATNTTHTTINLTTQPKTEEIKDSPEKYADNSKKKDASEKTASKSENSADNKTSDKNKSSVSGKSEASKKKTTSKSGSGTVKTKKSLKIIQPKKTPKPPKHKKPKKANSQIVNQNNASNAQKILLVTPKTNKTHKSKEKCVINGTTCYVGDTIKITVNLKYSKILENFQGYSTFDPDYLSCKSVKANIGLVNNKDENIYFNASVITGLDFTSNGTIYSAEFKVNKPGSTKITNTMEIITDIDEKDVKPSEVQDTIAVFS